MFVRYNYKLNPTPEQDQLLRQVAGNQRWIWNQFLGKEIEQYKENKTFNFYHNNAISLPSLKKEFEWLKLGPSQSLQQTLKDLNAALKMSFRGKDKGFPKFKKRKEFSGSFRIVQTTDKWKYGCKFIDLPKIGKMKWKYHRKIPSTFSTATILLDGNKWYISIVVNKETKEPVDIDHADQVVGIDLNSKLLVVTSNGEVSTNPKFFKQQQKKIARKQKQLSKKQKGSNRRKKFKLKLYNNFKKLRNQRTNHVHQISAQITNVFDLICMEDLNIKSIQRSLGSVINDAGWSKLVSMIMYKSKLKGKQTVKIDRFAPSSKTCNNCGSVKTIELSERIYCCDNCNISVDRDLNAAKNIRDWGIIEFNTSGTGEIYGCGDTNIGADLSARYVSLKRQKFFSSYEKKPSFL